MRSEPIQLLPNSDDFGAAMGQRGTVLRAHPLHVGSRVSCRAGLFDGATAKWSELTFGAGGSEERVYGWVSSLSDDGRRFKVDCKFEKTLRMVQIGA